MSFCFQGCRSGKSIAAHRIVRQRRGTRLVHIGGSRSQLLKSELQLSGRGTKHTQGGADKVFKRRLSCIERERKKGKSKLIEDSNAPNLTSYQEGKTKRREDKKKQSYFYI